MINGGLSQKPEELLRRVGMKCFVNCFDHFEAEAKGLCGHDATKRAMSRYGGAKTDSSVATKASSGLLIIKHGMAEAALAVVRNSKKVSADVRAQAQALIDRQKGLVAMEFTTRKSAVPAIHQNPRYWLYKCGPSGSDYGDWDVIFRTTQARDWYADGMKLETWGSALIPHRGDIIIAQQSKPTPHVVGLAEVVACPPPCRLRLRPLIRFESPVFLRPLKDAQEAVEAIRALHGGIVASLYLLSEDDAHILLEAIKAPPEYWPDLGNSAVDEAISDKTWPETGAGFGSAEENRRVERAAISLIETHLTADGWKVRSVEAEKCGYDLSATRARETLHVEVKGIRGGEITFFLTANEYKHMFSDKYWQLAVVTRALSKKPVPRFFSAHDAQSLAWAPILYQGSIKHPAIK